MLTTYDLLNICLAIGFVVLVIFASFTLYTLATTLRVIRETIVDINLMKDGVKVGVLSLVKNLLAGRR